MAGVRHPQIPFKAWRAGECVMQNRDSFSACCFPPAGSEPPCGAGNPHLPTAQVIPNLINMLCWDFLWDKIGHIGGFFSTVKHRNLSLV